MYKVNNGLFPSYITDLFLPISKWNFGVPPKKQQQLLYTIYSN